MTDDGWEDDETEAHEQEAVAAQLTLIPGYLFLADDAQKAEARRAYALEYVVSKEGGFHPQWASVWETIVKYLANGEFPQVAELRAIKKKTNEHP